MPQTDSSSSKSTTDLPNQEITVSREWIKTAMVTLNTDKFRKSFLSHSPRYEIAIDPACIEPSGYSWKLVSRNCYGFKTMVWNSAYSPENVSMMEEELEELKEWKDPYKFLKKGDIITVYKENSTVFIKEGLVNDVRPSHFEVDHCSYNPGHAPDHFIKIHPKNMGSAIPCGNVIEKLRNLTRSDEEKALVEFGLENPLGTPTEEGLKFHQHLAYGKDRAEVIAAVMKIKKSEETQK